MTEKYNVNIYQRAFPNQILSASFVLRHEESFLLFPPFLPINLKINFLKLNFYVVFYFKGNVLEFSLKKTPVCQQ